jgi:AraC-like DNA-binding protein
MISHAYVPAPPLAQFVELFWYQKGDIPAHSKERLMPDGATTMVINLHIDELPLFDPHNPSLFTYCRGSILHGSRSEFAVIDTRYMEEIIGVQFRVGGAFPFFNMPADELNNAMLSLETLWGAGADDLRSRLLEAQSLRDKFRVVEQFLLLQAVQPLSRHRAVDFALREFRNTRTVSNVTDQIGLSATRFIQVFREEVGLTPKLFCRVQRFQQVLRMIHCEQNIDWVSVALTCGYFDQAHFIHDFQAFSGFNPMTYLTQRSDHFNHVPLLD